MELPKIIDDQYVEEELKKEAKAFASGKGENTGFCLRGLCGRDVSKIDMSNLSQESFLRLTFNSETIFPENQELMPRFVRELIKKGECENFADYTHKVIEQGKQFGDIGKSEIDGSGTTIAIIDRFSDVSEKQFEGEGRTITVYRVSEDGVEEVQSNEEGIYLEDASVEDELENGYHGNTIASLTVGKECGVAPKANVILFHVDGIENQEAQDAVLKFIAKNKEKEGFTIPDIISISAKTNINKQTLEELEELGCAFINSDIFMKDFTWGRSNDGHELVRDKFIQYTIDAFADRGIDINKLFSENMLIPVTGRTSSYINNDGEEVYKYNGSFCGNSFAIGQVAGLFLKARQIDKSISFDGFVEIASDTARENDDGMKYIDIDRVINKVQKNKIDRSMRNRTFNNQKIGKATINTPTKDKQEVEQFEQENMRQNEKINEGESIDEN